VKFNAPLSHYMACQRDSKNNYAVNIVNILKYINEMTLDSYFSEF